jgi:hypothetical protein
MLPRSVVERSARRKEIRIHELSRKDNRVETLFVTRKTVVRSSALDRFIEVIATQGRNGKVKPTARNGDNARLHPGPLPQEREKRLPRL